MAKKMSQDKAAKPAKAGHNGFDPAVLNSLVERIENIETDIESEKGASMQRCKSMHEDIADIIQEANARGIPTKPFKKVLKTRKLNRKIEELRADLDDMVDRESYDQIIFALGGDKGLVGTPFGDEALKGKAPANGKADETADRVASNVAALKGIKPLPPGSPTAA